MLAYIPVAPYVYKYLSREFGSAPYDLTASHTHVLKMAFQHLRLGAEHVPKTHKTPGRTVILDLGTDRVLQKLYGEFQPLIRAGSHFHSQFMERMYLYVSDQEDLAQTLDLSKKQWNRESALRAFLHKYEITEIDYPYDSASRQLRRLIYPREGYHQRQNLKAFIDRKFVFRKAPSLYVKWISGWNEYQNPDELFSPSEDMVRMCTLQEEKGVWRIHFSAYSRWHKGLKPCTLRVPDDIVKAGDLHRYTDEACAIINAYLLDGFTIN